MRSTLSRVGGASARGLIAALLLGLMTLACAACGQRGPLYLPDSASAPERATPAEDAAPASDEEATETTADVTEEEDRQ